VGTQEWHRLAHNRMRDTVEPSHVPPSTPPLIHPLPPDTDQPVEWYGAENLGRPLLSPLA